MEMQISVSIVFFVKKKTEGEGYSIFGFLYFFYCCPVKYF